MILNGFVKQEKEESSFSEISSKREIRESVDHIIEEHDLSIEVDVEIADRFKRKAGQYRHDEGKIRISKHLLENYPEKVIGTIKHKLGHAVAMHRYNADRHIQPHGKEWKSVMRKIGVEELEACHDLQLTDYSYTVRCSNPDCDVEAGRHRKSKLVKKPGLYACKECGSKFESFEVE